VGSYPLVYQFHEEKKRGGERSVPISPLKPGEERKKTKVIAVVQSPRKGEGRGIKLVFARGKEEGTSSSACYPFSL